MPGKNDLDPKEGKGNYGPGGFGDMYDNDRLRSMDRDQNPGGVTGIQFDDDTDLSAQDFSPDKGASYPQDDRMEPSRDADLGFGESGTGWNRDVGRDHSGRGPKGWKLSDEKLKDKVSEVLFHSHDVDPSELEVTVEDNVVYLKGNIQSKGMRRVAEDLVGSIPGVIDVFTQLKIKDTSNFQLSSEAYNEARTTDES